MNAKKAKRLRQLARVLTVPSRHRQVYQQLKREDPKAVAELYVSQLRNLRQLPHGASSPLRGEEEEEEG